MLQKILKTKKTIALAAGIVLGVLAVCGAVFLLSAAQKEKTEQKVTAEIVGQTETKQTKTEKKEDNSEFVIPENYVSVVTIKINPEFRIYLDEQMHVLAVEPVNTDAEEMAADEDWADITLGDFMNRIIVTAYEQGYLKDGATVFAGIETKEESLLNTIIEKIKACVKETVNRIPIQVILEPYCYGQFTEGKASPQFGRSHVHWLTGTASTVMVGCVEGILGMRPDFGGIRIAPSVPKEWGQFEVEKDFRGKHLHIVFKNKNHVQSGCRKMIVDGVEIAGNYIREEILKEHTEIEYVMS